MIMRGQKVHVSLSFIRGDYTPKATFHPDFRLERDNPKWDGIIGIGTLDNVNWAGHLEDVLEMDLFDIPSLPGVIQGYIEGPNSEVWAERLEFMAEFREPIFVSPQ